MPSSQSLWREENDERSRSARLPCPVCGSLGGPAVIVCGRSGLRQRVPSGQEAGSTSEDVNEEVRFGREVAARMIGRYGLYQNDQLTRYVNLVGLTLAAMPPAGTDLPVRRSEHLRHQCLRSAGRYIFVTRGALEKMQDESELAGVLAHEIVHVNERHVVRELGIRATDDSAASGLARMIGGGSETARVAFTQAVDKAVDILFKTGYKREDEVQSDTGAVAICAIVGYDPAGLVRYFERINASKGKNTEVLDKTHPSMIPGSPCSRRLLPRRGSCPGITKRRKSVLMKR